MMSRVGDRSAGFALVALFALLARDGWAAPSQQPSQVGKAKGAPDATATAAPSSSPLTGPTGSTTVSCPAPDPFCDPPNARLRLQCDASVWPPRSVERPESVPGRVSDLTSVRQSRAH